ncbi:hypothetical protein Tco_0823116 [Tanacetum coccineum]|uniref:Uncharacterized protein n=1 Tax=Tanacetum coccineum TaxID=301880 RepID=A0ABQ5AKA7_9ASTR
MVVHNQEEMGEGSAILIDPHHTPTFVQPSPQPQKTLKPRIPKKKDTQVPQSCVPSDNVADEAVYKELDDSLVRATTTASSLEVEQDNGNIIKTLSKTTPNEAGSQGTTLGGGPRRQETMGDTIAQTRSENVSKLSNDLLFARGNTLRSGKDSLKPQELMALCTTLQKSVLDLKQTKTTQAEEIVSLKRRVKKLEQKKRLRTYRLKRLYMVGSSRRVKSFDEEGLGEEDASKHGRIANIDANKDTYLVNVHTDEDMFGVNDLDGDEVIVDNVDVVKTVEETRSVIEEVTFVIEKAKSVSAAKETVNAAATTVSTASTIPVSAATTTTTTTVITDDEITLAKALAELKSTKLLTQGIGFRKPTTPTVSSQQPSQVKVQDKGKSKMVELEPMKKMSKKDLLRLDEELAFKLKVKEEEERLAREKAQQIKEVNIAWDDVQAKVEADYQLAQRLQAQEQEELTDEEKARLFVQFLKQRRKHCAAKRSEEKRNIPPTKSQQRSIMCTYLKNMEGWKPNSLKNKSFANIQELFDKAIKRVDEDKERTELQSLIEVIPNEEEVAIDDVPLATKPPIFSQMLKSFSRGDLEDLYNLVKAKYGSTRPVEDLDLILYGDLKTMFDPHVVDQVWKNQQDYKVLDWKLYDSCGVHSLRMQHVYIHMLFEKRYPLTPATITDMLNKKLQVDYLNEMAYQLLKLLTKQLKNQ